MPNKKKCHQYSVEYLKFGFCESILNKTKPYCLILAINSLSMRL